MAQMKAYKKYASAKLAAQGEPIVRVGDLYIVGVKLAGLGLDEITLFDGRNGSVAGTIILKHLDRLGNANWAQLDPKSPFTPGPTLWPDE